MVCDILSVVRSFGNRYESWLYRQIADLRRHHVHVLANRYVNQKEYPHSPVTILSRIGILLDRIRKIPRYVLGGRRPVAGPHERAVLTRLLQEDGIRIIQAHYSWVGVRVADVVQRSEKPFLVWVYGSDVFRALGPWAGRIVALFSMRGMFCCTSNALKQGLVDHGCPPERIAVIHPGVEVPPQPPQRQLQQGKPLRIVSVGRMVDFKKPDQLVDLAATLRDRGVDFTWEYLGDGELRPFVEDAIRRTELGGSCHLLGELSHQTVLDRLRSADVMVHNAVVAPDGGRESFGVVLAEASAAGLPIVSARVGGIPEIVRDSETGYLVEEGNIEGMAEKVELLAREPELRMRLGEAAHGRATELFEAGKQAEKLDAFYDGLLERRILE